jgi:hypothetical protein
VKKNYLIELAEDGICPFWFIYEDDRCPFGSAKDKPDCTGDLEKRPYFCPIKDHDIDANFAEEKGIRGCYK